jgi:hypothetical protein
MANSSPLDMPLEQGRVIIRKSNSTLLESILGVTNLLFFIVFNVAVITSIRNQGIGVVTIVLYVFATVFTAVVCSFLYRWNKATHQYESKNDVEAIRAVDPGFPSIISMMALFFWGIYLWVLAWGWKGVEFTSITILLRYTLFLLPGIILGPFQFFYFKRLSKIRNFVLNYHAANP